MQLCAKGYSKWIRIGREKRKQTHTHTNTQTDTHLFVFILVEIKTSELTFPIWEVVDKNDESKN